MTTVASAPALAMREATTADLPRLAEMFECFRATGPYAQYGPAHPDISTRLIERLVLSDQGVVLIAAEHEGLVGMLGLVLTPHPWSGERTATELFWWVEPAFRGRGGWLLKRAERWAIDHGATRLLMISPQSPQVDQLYAALGYTPVETSWQKSLTWFDRHPHRPDRLPHGLHVHDEILPDPHAYRAMALHQRFQAVRDGAVTFQRMAPCAHPAVPMWIARQYPQLTPTLTFFRQGEQDQAEPHYIHTDASMGDWTGILYLNPDAPLGDGTAFWRHQPTGDLGSLLLTKDEAAKWCDPAVWQPWQSIEARFNRLVLFPARLYHSRGLPENYGQGESARLIQVVFGTGVLR